MNELEISQKIFKINDLINAGKISEEEGYMYCAYLQSMLSKDPNTKVGCIITNPRGRIISRGANRAVRGSENTIDWNNRDSRNWLESKYPYIVHSERDAIYNAQRESESLKYTNLYVTLYPCNECAIAIVENEIKHLYYLDDKYHDLPNTVAARRILNNSNVIVKQVELPQELIEDIEYKLSDEKVKVYTLSLFMR